MWELKQIISILVILFVAASADSETTSRDGAVPPLEIHPRQEKETPGQTAQKILTGIRDTLNTGAQNVIKGVEHFVVGVLGTINNAQLGVEAETTTTPDYEEEETTKPTTRRKRPTLPPYTEEDPRTEPASPRIRTSRRPIIYRSPNPQSYTIIRKTTTTLPTTINPFLSLSQQFPIGHFPIIQPIQPGQPGYQEGVPQYQIIIPAYQPLPGQQPQPPVVINPIVSQAQPLIPVPSQAPSTPPPQVINISPKSGVAQAQNFDPSFVTVAPLKSLAELALQPSLVPATPLQNYIYPAKPVIASLQNSVPVVPAAVHSIQSVAPSAVPPQRVNSFAQFQSIVSATPPPAPPQPINTLDPATAQLQAVLSGSPAAAPQQPVNSVASAISPLQPAIIASSPVVSSLHAGVPAPVQPIVISVQSAPPESLSLPISSHEVIKSTRPPISKLEKYSLGTRRPKPTRRVITYIKRPFNEPIMPVKSGAPVRPLRPIRPIEIRNPPPVQPQPLGPGDNRPWPGQIRPRPPPGDLNPPGEIPSETTVEPEETTEEAATEDPDELENVDPDSNDLAQN